MKASSWLCATLWLLCSTLAAQNLAETGWESWRDNSTWYTRLDWGTAFPSHWQHSFVMETQTARDGSFDRESRQGSYHWQSLRQMNGLAAGLVFRVNRLRDTSLSSLEDYEYTRCERAAGLRVDVLPTNGLELTNEWRWGWREARSTTVLNDNKTETDGLRGESRLVWQQRLGLHRVQLRSGIDYAGIQQDEGRNWQSALVWEVPLPRHLLRTELTYNDARQAVYQNFVHTDTQKRTVWRVQSRYESQALPMIDLRTDATLDRLHNRFDATDSRDYTQDRRRLDLLLRMPVRHWLFTMQGGRGYLTKDYTTRTQNLQQEEWLLEGAAAWEFSRADTLRFVRSARLVRSDMPNAAVRTDNDLLEDIWSLGLRWFVRDRVHLDTGYERRTTQRVYINAQMSGQNNKRIRHLLAPTLSIAAGRGWLIEQSYSLLADYDDYRWNFDRADRFYRQFVGQLRLAWDGSPDLRDVSDIVWPTLVGSYSDRNWRFEARYAYTQSEGGDWEDDSYLIDDEHERHEAGLLLGKTGQHLLWSAQALMTWDYQRELRLPIALQWRLGDTFLQVQVEPRGQVQRLPAGTLDLLDLPYPRMVRRLEWQADLSLQIAF